MAEEDDVLCELRRKGVDEREIAGHRDIHVGDGSSWQRVEEVCGDGGVGEAPRDRRPVDDNNVADARARLAPYHRFFGAAAFVAGAGTCVSGLVEKQAFSKCPIDPTYKFCAVVALPNVMVVLVLLVASCACECEARCGPRR